MTFSIHKRVDSGYIQTLYFQNYATRISCAPIGNHPIALLKKMLIQDLSLALCCMIATAPAAAAQTTPWSPTPAADSASQTPSSGGRVAAVPARGGSARAGVSTTG